MLIKNINDVEKETVTIPGALNAFKQVIIGKADKTPNYSLRVFTIKPNGNTPYHNHNYEHINYVIKGNGYLLDKDRDKHPIKEGEFAIIYPNEMHGFFNESHEEDLVIICLVPKEFE